MKNQPRNAKPEPADAEEAVRRPLPGWAKKIILVVVILAGIAALYAAAAGIGFAVIKNTSRPIDDAALAARMEELLPAADKVNEIVWGAGLAADHDAEPALDTVEGAQYRPVARDAGYGSLVELRAAISAVYSQRFIDEVINSIVFDGSEGAIEGYEMYPRYADKKFVNDDGSTEERLAVDITRTGFELKAELDPASAAFVRNEIVWDGLWWRVDRVVVSVSETFDGAQSSRELFLVQQDGVWLLDTPTY